jgi:hypothetical protein
MFPTRRITTMGGDKFRDEFSLAFDGTDDYVNCGHNSDFEFDNGSASLFHVSIWVKITGGTGSDDTFISKYDYGVNKREWRISLNASQQLKCVFSSNGTATASAQTSSTLVQDRWYNIGLTYDGTQGTADNRCTIYLDGVIQTFSSAGTIPAQVNEDDAPLTISCMLSSGSASGIPSINVSEVAIYDTFLSASQVKTLYNGREPYNHKEGIASGNLKAWWRMGDGRLDGSAQITGDTDDSPQDNIISDEVDSSLGAELYTPANSMSTNEADDTATGLTVNDGTTVADETSITNGSGRSLKYTASGVSDGVSIDLTSDIVLTAGSVYKVSVDARHIGSGGLQTIRLAEQALLGTDGETLEIIDISNSMTTFVTYTAYFIHSNTTTRYFGAREQSGTDDGGLYLDNLSVRQVNGNAGIMNNMDYNFEGDTP